MKHWQKKLIPIYYPYTSSMCRPYLAIFSFARPLLRRAYFWDQSVSGIVCKLYNMIYKIIFVYPLHGHAHTIIHIIYTFIILVRGEVVGRMIIKLKIKEDGLYLTYLPYKSCLWVIQSVWEVAPSPTAGDPPGSPLSQWGEGMDAVCAHNIIPYQAHVHVYQLD